MTEKNVRELHEETSADAYSAACADGNCSEVHVDDVECPVTEVSICGYCFDRGGEPEFIAEWLMWPCETIRALDQQPEGRES